MNDITLKTEDLVCGYQPNCPLFDPVSLELRRGEITAILGGNGQGKTTLMKTLLGHHQPLQGQVAHAGEINFVPQRFDSAFSYSVIDMVLMGRANNIGLFSSPSHLDFQMAHQALDMLSIGYLAEHEFDRLSGGQQQLVLIARALATKCDVLILDEPTTALDLAFQSTVIELLYSLAKERNISVLFSTHEPAQAQLIADNILLIMKDKRCLTGNKRDILTEQNLTELYGVPIQKCQIRRDNGCYTTFLPYFGGFLGE
ncbi:ABC transporter ATP-binding protein [Vibrio nitrifigilis]|uniref:ABC transporter ATP-binding protein n=1 Tax=Vibrio nitrifigilis TaxID=2789781 RepID=A0ABS0GLC9_9VIBR|nr:ABC transporter ATP-binding protein [Vibrio nitrifigilis]MBF9003285.1 ABC transporter ATP-binding protein [Vibrio nitrifigilis]